MNPLDHSCLIPAEQCACKMLRSLSRRTTRWYESHLREFDLTAGQFTVLVMLQLRGPISMATAGPLIGADRTTLYRAVKPLRSRHLVADSPDPEDRRSRRFELTDAGRQLLQSALPHWQRAQREFVEAVDGTRWALLLPDLSRISRAIDQLLEKPTP